METLQVADIVLLCAVIFVSIGIGVYFAIFSKSEPEEYLMGGRQLSVLPIALSILATFVSASGTLGNAAEMYAYGTQFSLFLLANAIGSTVGAFVFVPLLYPLRLTSVFEYYEMRFNSKLVRISCSVISLVNMLLFNGIGIFAPSLALAAVSNVPVWISILVCAVTVTLYTTVGGLRAVVWTDSFQALVILIGLLAVLVKGTLAVGGLAEVWRLNEQYGRIRFFDFNPDPRVRTTFWNVVVLMSVLFMCLSAAQPSVQRYSALKSVREAKIAMLLNVPGFTISGGLTCLCGVVAFAYYAKLGCDPLMTTIGNPNQILPRLVMDAANLPGLPGLFVACLFSASLSTLSSNLNSGAAMTSKDVLFPWIRRSSQRRQGAVLKIIVLVYGVASLGMAFIVQSFPGTFIQILFSVLGATMGPIVGILFLGGLCPRAGWIGALAGGLLGLLVSSWMALGSLIHKIYQLPLPAPIHNCSALNRTLRPEILKMMASFNVNATTPRPGGALHSFYSVSYLWYPAVGIVSVLLVGFVTSFVPGLQQEKEVPDRLLFPCVASLRKCCCCQEHVDDEQEPEHSKAFLPTSHAANPHVRSPAVEFSGNKLRTPKYQLEHLTNI